MFAIHTCNDRIESMKKIEFSKPIAVIPVGYPGSGKTFTSNHLGVKLHIPVLSKERIAHELFDSAELSRQEQSVVDRIYDYTIHTQIAAKADFICDGGFDTNSKRKALVKELRVAGYVPLVVWVQTDMDTAFSRAAKRNKRKSDDKYRQSISMDQFDSAQKAFKRPTENETYVVVSGKHAFSAQYKTILRKLSLIGALDNSSISVIQSNMSR